MKGQNTMKKSETLEAWRALEPNQPIMPYFTAIPYKASGSKYGACGIRIDGNPAFIDAVLSHLKELIEGECADTRLQLSRNAVDNRLAGHNFKNRESDAECCYIRLHERGNEGRIMYNIEHRRMSPSAAVLESWTNCPDAISQGGRQAAQMVLAGIREEF